MSYTCIGLDWFSFNLLRKLPSVRVSALLSLDECDTPSLTLNNNNKKKTH